MRFTCPHCGARDSREFTYLGDAKMAAGGGDFEAVYLRDNPAGVHRELWQHVLGCRAWLEIERNTLTHEVLAVKEAGQ